jgi:hypothetical protein
MRRFTSDARIIGIHWKGVHGFGTSGESEGTTSPRRPCGRAPSA